jgi:hypothetical protein
VARQRARRTCALIAALVLLVGCGTADRADSAHPGPGRAEVSADAGPGEMSDKNFVFDENGAPTYHTDRLWGNYVDKDGKPQVGWHSHDPKTGVAR